MSGWQVDIRHAVHRVWDVAIVGGGPAGLVAALHLARRGLAVLVLERYTYPREKVCGDALIADSIRVLDRAGLLRDVEARAFETNSLRLYSPSQIEVVIPSRTLVIKRIEFDEMLARAAATAGAVVAHAVVERVEEGALAGIKVRGVQTSVKSKIAVVATGADVRLPASLGMVTNAKPSVVAVRRYVHSATDIDQLMFSFDRTIAPGYAWLFPLRNGEYNVGCGMAYGRKRIDLAATLDGFIHNFEPLRAFAKGISHEQPVRGAVLRCGLKGTSPWLPPNILVIGESLGTTFPFTGEGIGKAMETGERAAAVVSSALEAGNLQLLGTFAAEIEALRRRYRGYELAERWLARPWLADLVTCLAQRSPHAITCAAAVLNETGDPREIFSARGLWNMFRA